VSVKAFIHRGPFGASGFVRGLGTVQGTAGKVGRLAGRMWGEVKGPLYRNALFLMLSSVIGAALGFFFLLVVTRVYADTDVGAALTLISTIGFLAAVATLGFGIGLIRFLPGTADRPALVNESLSIAGVLALVLALVFALGVNVWAPTLDFILETPIYVVLIAITAMGYAFAPILDTAAVAARRADLSTWRVTIFSVLKVPMPLLLVPFLSGRLGIYMAWSIALGISVLIAGFVFTPRAIAGYRPRPRFRGVEVRPIFAFSLGNWVASVIGVAATLLLPLLVTNTLGVAQAAYFWVAFSVASILFVIPGATTTSLLAEASQANARRRRDERRAILFSFALLVPGILGVEILAAPILSLFGPPEYVAAGVEPVRILALASIPIFLSGLLGTRIRIRKKVWPLIAAVVVETSVVLGLGYVLLENLEVGLPGLAWAFVLGSTAQVPILFAAARGPIEIEEIEPAPVPP